MVFDNTKSISSIQLYFEDNSDITFTTDNVNYNIVILSNVIQISTNAVDLSQVKYVSFVRPFGSIDAYKVGVGIEESITFTFE